MKNFNKLNGHWDIDTSAIQQYLDRQATQQERELNARRNGHATRAAELLNIYK